MPCHVAYVSRRVVPLLFARHPGTSMDGYAESMATSHVAALIADSSLGSFGVQPLAV